MLSAEFKIAILSIPQQRPEFCFGRNRLASQLSATIFETGEIIKSGHGDKLPRPPNSTIALGKMLSTLPPLLFFKLREIDNLYSVIGPGGALAHPSSHYMGGGVAVKTPNSNKE